MNLIIVLLQYILAFLFILIFSYIFCNFYFTSCKFYGMISYNKIGGLIMNVNVKDIRDVVAKINFRKCGTITCIHNVDNKCIQKECELHERGLKREED